ncbi:MAG: hypothetical protein US70_C0012G0013 [Parcubacteria group bacterium GW2011_GWD2_38_11]|nr:MAG: hypothetical protein US70_C0012G0013 [Parcubacteria group bacterium GW2011_GWD2_38_11]
MTLSSCALSSSACRARLWRDWGSRALPSPGFPLQRRAGCFHGNDTIINLVNFASVVILIRAICIIVLGCIGFKKLKNKNMLVFSAIMPHPPTSIPGVGNADDLRVLSKTLNALEALRIGLETADPDTVIVISPHAHLEPYAFVINSESELQGSLSQFGYDKVFTYKNNIEITDELAYACAMNEMPAHLHPSFLDHGTLIPLYHLTKNIKPKIVQLSFSLMDYERHYRYGQIIQKVIDRPNSGRVAVIASGDLSHKITPSAPAGFSPSAEAFDHSVIRFLGSGDLTSLMNMEEQTIQEAAECGLRSIVILLGILHEKKYNFELLNYEAPSGVGHLTARLL